MNMLSNTSVLAKFVAAFIILFVVIIAGVVLCFDVIAGKAVDGNTLVIISTAFGSAMTALGFTHGAQYINGVDGTHAKQAQVDAMVK